MMNLEQKRYALNRIEQIKNQKIQSARDKFRIKAVRMSSSERIDLIYAGKVKLLPKNQIHHYTDLCDGFDFSKFETQEGFRTGFEELQNTINKLANGSRDQVMLGECEEALNLIKQLEDLKV